MNRRLLPASRTSPDQKYEAHIHSGRVAYIRGSPRAYSRVGNSRRLQQIGIARPPRAREAACARKVMGIDFPNPVGLAAGLDKNGEYIDALAHSRFRLHRSRHRDAAPAAAATRGRVCSASRKRKRSSTAWASTTTAWTPHRERHPRAYRGVLGINIGKNFDTPIERAVDDYLECLRKVYRSRAT